MNKLYDGAFQSDISENPNKHLELMENADQVFYNISEVYKAMDELRYLACLKLKQFKKYLLWTKNLINLIHNLYFSHQIDDSSSKADYKYFPLMAKNFEKYRWPATMALQGEILTHFC